jgi:hypothetical protein
MHGTEGVPNLSAERVRAIAYRSLPYPTVPYRTFVTVFRDFF